MELSGPFVGVSLLAIAVYQSALNQLTVCYREQAHSYKGSSQISEFQGSSLGRHFSTLLAAGADQLYLNFLRRREGIEDVGQIQRLQRTRCGAAELVMRVDFAVVMVMLVTILVRFIVVMVVGIRLVAECPLALIS